MAGEVGVGKTTLARRALAGTGLTVLEGVGVQGGTSAFGPVVEVLRTQLRSAGDGPLLEGPLAGHLALLLPELGPPAAEGDRATLFEAIGRALAAIAARGPAAVFLDDLQWADDATLELLAALARSLDTQPLLVCGAFRSDELPRGHPIRRLRSELRRAGRLRQLTVEPLGAEATAALLERALGAAAGPSLRRAVFDRTDGVPFFVDELASTLAAGRRLETGPAGLELLEGEDVPLPDSVRDAVLLRAAGLSDEARDVVLAAAVAGQTFDPELVTAVAGLPEWPEELLRRGIVTEAGPGRMTFRHALVREAFYGEVPWTRRVALHRAVAQRLEAAHAAPLVVAEHWALGRRPDQAGAALLGAAEAFCGVHAYRDAARTTRRALELWPEERTRRGRARLDALERLAGCAELAGDLVEAATHLAGGRRRAPAGGPSGPSRRGPPAAGRRPGAPGPLAGGAGQPGAGRRRLHRRRPGGRGRRRTACLGRPPPVGGQLPGGPEPAGDRRRSRPGRLAGSTCRRGSSARRATSAPAWARARRRSSRSGPAWPWPWSTAWPGRRPRSTSGWPTPLSTPATTRRPRRPTTRRPGSAPPTPWSPPPSSAWPA